MEMQTASLAWVKPSNTIDNKTLALSIVLKFVGYIHKMPSFKYAKDYNDSYKDLLGSMSIQVN